mgnify:CR=1 FL=1
MNRQEILNQLAPCGLNCNKCMANESGQIKHHSQKLKKLLGNFEGYAKRFSKFMPIFNQYNEFKELLNFFTIGSCNGCRAGDCKYPNCGAAKCYQEKKIDFCFECNEFPCDKTNFDENLKERWIKMNNRMKEIGVEKYYDETKDLPRYV